MCINALKVSEVQEFFRSPNKPMHEVLSKAAQVLSKVRYVVFVNGKIAQLL